MTKRKNKLVVTLPSDLEIRMERRFDAPRELVFEAWSKAEHVARWWGCGQGGLKHCEMDFRVGGQWRYVIDAGEGVGYPFKGEYKEIDPPKRIVTTMVYDEEPFNQDFILVETNFQEVEGGTLMVELNKFNSKEARDGMIQNGMEEGTIDSLDQLEDLLSSLQN